MRQTKPMRMLRSGERRATAWKNGGGMTTEIAVSPPGARFDDFDWRISMAQVVEDGPFSSFPDIERTLTVLEGVMTLTLDRERSVRLAPQSAPFVFSGDVAVDAIVDAGPVLDVNVMSRRGRVAHAVRRVRIESDMHLVQSADVMILVALGDGLRVDACAMERHDAAMSDQRGESFELRADAVTEILVIEIRDLRSSPDQLL